MSKRVILFAPDPPLLEKARRLGLDRLCVYTKDEVRRLPEDLLTDELCLVLPFLDRVDQLIETVTALHAARRFDAVFATQEQYLMPAARLNDALGLGGVPAATVQALLNKAETRRLTAGYEWGAVRAREATERSDIVEFGREVGYPLIVKPLGGAGSIGVFRVDAESEVAAAYGKLADCGLERFLLEEFLDGPEISIDSLSFDGHHVPVAIADKNSGHDFIEFGHTIPAALDADVERQVCTVVGELLDAVGLRDGASHTEVKLTSRGPRVVEGHNRRGGDQMTLMAKAGYGVDLEEVALAWAAGTGAPMVDRPAPRKGVSIAYFQAEPGRLTAVRGLEVVENHPAVTDFHVGYEVGQEIPVVRWSGDRVGFVLVEAGTHDEALRTAQYLVSAVTFETEPGEPSGTTAAEHRELMSSHNLAP